MIIEEVNISKFRGFQNQHFRIGEQLTIIAGQNGTQKTTLLGMLSQTFSLRNHPDEDYRKEKPLCGGNFISSFSEKFKFSEVYDKPGEHEWSLKMKGETEPFVIASMLRDKKSNELRFWRKGNREKGSGYLQYPVIFLSLKRLFPIGEDEKLFQSDTVNLTPDEKKKYQELHHDILISLDKIIDTDYLESPNKNTLGVNTDYYDWKTNSAGQDNVGKIILALLSFERLKSKYNNIYKGGLLVIDELDATMYPGSQQKLLGVLKKYASKLKIQIVFTTHSHTLLEHAFKLKDELNAKEQTNNQIRILYLSKVDNNVEINDTPTFEEIEDNLNVAVGNKKPKKINVFTEDDEAWKVFNALRKRKGKLNKPNISLPCTFLTQLVYKKVESFSYPNSIVILDGDVGNDKNALKLLKGKKNVLLLPTNKSPEQFLANMLYNLSERDPLWCSIHPSYKRQVCFKNIRIEEISDRTKAKEWFKEQIKQVGEQWVTKVVNKWKEDNLEDYSLFLTRFSEVYNNIAEQLDIETI